MRVLQVLPSVVSGGGAEQSLAMLAPLLIDRGIELHLAVLDEPGDLAHGLESLGVVVHDLSGARSGMGRTLALRHLLRHLRPDVVHSTLFWADLATRFAALGLPVAVLSTWANTSYDPVRGRLEPGAGGWKHEVVRVVDLVTARLARSRFHAVTQGVAVDGMRALHVTPDRVTVVERGRDLSRFVPPSADDRAAARDELGLGPDDAVVMCVARQAHQKGHVFLLDAFAEASGRLDALRLVLVGPTGSASPLVLAARNRLAHPERVLDLGPRRDIPRLLGAADVFVLASVAEGAAGAILEAMAVGVPVVTSRLAGLEGWLVEGEHALEATPGDAHELAAAIEQTLRDPSAARTRADAAQRLVRERFSLERCADDMAGMYRQIGARRR